MKRILILSACAIGIVSVYSAQSTETRHYLNHNYDKVTARVRVGNDACIEEIQFLTQRSPFIKKNIEALTELTLTPEEVPNIALCCSGGGYRAMIATLGSLDGMDTSPFYPSNPITQRSIWAQIVTYFVDLFNGKEDTHKPPLQPTALTSLEPTLLNACAYIAGLSGSTWAINGWVQANKRPGQYITHIQNSIKDRLTEKINTNDIIHALSEKKGRGQEISIIDWYGCLIAQKLLHGLGYANTNMIDVTDITARIKTGACPLPISINVIETTPTQYEHIEFTPFEVGSSYLNGYIPLWAFGRTFEHGKSRNFHPPVTLGFCMGVWGSAMSANLREIWQSMSDKNKPLLALIGNCKPISDHRFISTEIDNWTYQCTGTQEKNAPKLTLVDASMHMNIPLQPLLDKKRPVDIIIVLDASGGKIGSELHKAATYARDNNLPFPSIDYAALDKPISVHGDFYAENTPIVIYMPLVGVPTYKQGWNPRTEKFTSTLNFEYTPEQVRLLSGLTRHNALNTTHTIMEVIREWILAQRNMHHVLSS